MDDLWRHVECNQLDTGWEWLQEDTHIPFHLYEESRCGGHLYEESQCGGDTFLGSETRMQVVGG